MLQLDRRLFLKSAALIGCSAAAHPLMNSMTFAALPSDNRLALIIRRGAMDGLDALQPYGDPIFYLRSSQDAWVAIGPTPDASNGPRMLLAANTDFGLYVDPGDKLAWLPA